ncbi:MAG: hypothetical protein Q7R74_00145 [bacterium]|nr:hypothetical protein [bacterium]
MRNIWCALLVLLFVSGSCFAQGKTFKLNEKILEKGSPCFTLDAAMDVANGGSIKASEAILDAYVNTGACAVMYSTFIYSRKVYQYEEIRVYEGKIGDITIFNPTLSVAKDEKDI